MDEEPTIIISFYDAEEWLKSVDSTETRIRKNHDEWIAFFPVVKRLRDAVETKRAELENQ